MTAEAIVTVSAAVVACTQLLKWSGVPDRLGPLVVLVLAGLGVGVWVYSQGVFARAEVFALFAGWIAVATSAAGVYGYSRASASALTKLTPPPAGGAGGSSTVQ